METQEKPSFGFVAARLPWIVAVAAFLVYVVTLSPWARTDNLLTLASVGGWSLYVPVQGPLLHLLTLPVRLAPAGLQAPILNVLTALAAALTLALLARSVALLPFDRTRESRQRERSEFSLLSTPWAWLPVVLACVLCGLQLSFWEHATVLSGEMLDLLLFAFLIRCLLEYRIDRRDGWLTTLAFVYGLAVANNYAMLAYFPGFLMAVVWVKAWEFLNARFLVRMVLAGSLGLLLYLYLPLVGAMGGDHLDSFGQHLRAVFGAQLSSLRGLAPWIVLLLSFTSILPVFLLSIRWSSESPGTSVAGAAIYTLLVRVLQLILLFGSFSVFFDPVWSARSLGRGTAFLPLYYLSALSVGYFAGYFLLLSRSTKGRGWTPTPGLLERVGPVATGMALVVLVAAAAALVVRNWAPIRASNSGALARLGDQMVSSLPREGAYVLGDLTDDLLVLEGRLRHQLGKHPHVLLYSRWLELGNYHERLMQRYPGRWSAPPEITKSTEQLGSVLLMQKIATLALSNQVFYLNPSFGYYLEVMRLRPRGLLYRVESLKPDPLIPPPLAAEELKANQQFWESAAPGLRALVPDLKTGRGGRYLGTVYSRALNHFGVTLQRTTGPQAAAPWFELATELNADNVVARVNRAFNEELRGATPPGAKPSSTLETGIEPANWDSTILLSGPFDQPRWTLIAGEVFARVGFYRQALLEFDRVQVLSPTNALVRLWKENMEIMTRMRLGDPEGAEKQAVSLQQRYPQEEIACEALTQVYLLTGRLTNALANVDRQLQINPSNLNALLNKAAFHIQLNQFAQAIPPLDKLLSLQPQNGPATLNRAIAYLQSGNLDLAQKDYQALLKMAPQSAAVYYGLGEIAMRRKDGPAALSHYANYLKFGQKESDEYKSVVKRVEDLKRGGSAK